MDPLPEFLLRHGYFFDCCGLVGLGLVAISATRLSARHQCWGGTMMMSGALALFLARFFFIVKPHVFSAEWLREADPRALELLFALPPVLLFLGLAGIVWGLWGHERWLKSHGG